MKSEKGSARRSFAIATILTILMGYGAFVFAENMDVCNVYPKQSVYIGGATATQKVISGALGKQIYICSIEVAQNQATTGAGATPALLLSYGVQFSATPCATGSPYAAGAGIGNLITAGQSGSSVVGGNFTIAGPVPAAAASPAIDVCALVSNGNGIIGATVTYVQVP